MKEKKIYLRLDGEERVGMSCMAVKITDIVSNIQKNSKEKTNKLTQ